MRVGVDLDGVCFDFAESLRRYLRDSGLHTSYKVCDGETKEWNFFTGWGMSLDDFLKHCNDGVDAGFVFRGPTRPGTVKALRMIRDAGHEIHIITDRFFGSTPEVSHQATRDWLAEHKIPYDSLTFSADKTCVPTDVFVEDKLQNYDALVAAGVNAYLVNRPWNMAEMPDDRQRVTSVLHFAHRVVYGDSLGDIAYAA